MSAVPLYGHVPFTVVPVSVLIAPVREETVPIGSWSGPVVVAALPTTGVGLPADLVLTLHPSKDGETSESQN